MKYSEKDAQNAAPSTGVTPRTLPDLRPVGGLQWPFTRLLDSAYRQTDWVLVNGPIVTEQQQEQFAQVRRSDSRLGGMCSYITFPQPEPEVIRGRYSPDILDYASICEFWCHCFRNPDRYLSPTIPRALISTSDFVDYRSVSPEAVAPFSSKQSADFLYVGADEPWKKEAKNWRLAGRCIPKICRDLRLRAFVVGTPDSEFPASPEIVFSKPLQWHKLLGRLSTTRFLFVPNVLDASPRLISEALCLNVPVVVNSQILGGWKYVNRFTGVFFSSERDVVSAVRTCLFWAANPREWFRANFGPYLSGQRLLRLIKMVDPRISERSHVCLDELTAEAGVMLTTRRGKPFIGEQ